MKIRKRDKEGRKKGEEKQSEKQLRKNVQWRKSLMINLLIKDQSWESICDRNADAAFC